MRKSIFIFSTILLVGELLSWWVFSYSSLNIPTHIYGPINTAGLFLIILLFVVIILFQRQLLKLNSNTSFLRLTLLGGLVGSLAELAFQAIRFLTFNDYSLGEKLYYTCRGVIGITIMALLISLICALLTKRKVEAT